MNEHYLGSDDGANNGYIFLEFSSHGNAVEAVKSTNNYKLDRMHTFVVNLFTNFDKYESIPDEWETPLPLAYKDQGNHRSWLLESDTRLTSSLSSTRA